MPNEFESGRRRPTATRGRRLLLCIILLWPPVATLVFAGPVTERCGEITKLRRAAKYDEAISLARQTLAEVERDFGADSAEAAEVIVHLVTAISDLGKAGEGEALRLAQRSLAIRRAGEDAKGLGDSLLSLGTVQWRLGDYDSARRTLLESIEVYSRAFGAGDLLVSSPVENLGILLWNTGEYGEARVQLERALGIRQARLESGDDRIARTLNNLAILHYQMGNYALSRQMYERSLEIRESTDGRDSPVTADVIDNLALVLKAQGEGREAGVMFERALAIRERSLGAEHPLVAISLINIGEMLRESGELDRALESMQRALAINEKAYGGSHRRVAGALEGAAAVLLEMRRHDDARQSAERALAIREQIAPGDVRMSVALQLLSKTHDTLGDLQSALRLKVRAVEVAEISVGREHPYVATRLVDLALLQVKLGELEAAGGSLERAVSIREAQLGREHPDVALALGPLAFLRWQQGRLGDGRTAARRAGEIQDAALRSNFQALPEAHALYMASRSVEPEVVLFSGLLNGGDGPADWVGACWDWTLRRRGLVFDELARRQRSALISGSPERIAAWERLSEARRRLAALWIRGPEESDPQKYRDLLAGATEAKKSAETDLARATMETHPDLPAGRSEVQRALPKGGVLVEVVRVDVMPPLSRSPSRQDIALLLFGDGRMDFVRLGPAERIDGLVGDWRGALEAGIDRIVDGEDTADTVRESLRAGIALRRVVWDPIASKISPSATVFLVPDGALHRVDLRALPMEDGRYLVESKRAVHLLSTGRDLVRFARDDGKAQLAGRGLLALGAPDFSAPPGARLMAAARFRDAPAACLRVAERRWPPLPHSGLEVQEIAALAPKEVPVRVITGVAASEEIFRREATGKNAIHLATHGFFGSEECTGTGILGGNPLLLSGLVLAGAGRSDDKLIDDGVLTAEEIAGLDLTGVRLAVLSACDTGQGRIAVGEGVFGLRRALEIAGVRTVVMSLWRVPDRDARRWMKSFYVALFGGTAAGKATRQASLDALRRLRERDQPTHPYLWAGFVTAGDWH